MLILSRKLKESIMVGDNIEISIAGIEGDQVKLAISAPKHVDIHRKEIYLAIKEENKQAAVGSGDIAELLKKMSEDKE
jgi:carbon storage regulator